MAEIFSKRDFYAGNKENAKIFRDLHGSVQIGRYIFKRDFSGVTKLPNNPAPRPVKGNATAFHHGEARSLPTDAPLVNTTSGSHLDKITHEERAARIERWEAFAEEMRVNRYQSKRHAMPQTGKRIIPRRVKTAMMLRSRMNAMNAMLHPSYGRIYVDTIKVLPDNVKDDLGYWFVLFFENYGSFLEKGVWGWHDAWLEVVKREVKRASRKRGGKGRRKTVTI